MLYSGSGQRSSGHQKRVILGIRSKSTFATVFGALKERSAQMCKFALSEAVAPPSFLSPVLTL